MTGLPYFGFILDMAQGSIGELGAFASETIVERLWSACNLIMTDGRTLLSLTNLEMLACLRMDEDFMLFCDTNIKLSLPNIIKATQHNMQKLVDAGVLEKVSVGSGEEYVAALPQ